MRKDGLLKAVIVTIFSHAVILSGGVQYAVIIVSQSRCISFHGFIIDALLFSNDLLEYLKLPNREVVVDGEEVVRGLEPGPHGDQEELRDHELAEGLHMVVDG